MIITNGNNKGGTGKTTVTIYVAICLGRLGKKVLVIDNDTQCNCTQLLLGNHYEKTLYDLFSTKVDETFDIKNFITDTEHHNVHCIANHINTSGFDLEWQQNFPDSLLELRKRLIPVASAEYDYILIDTPPTLGIPLSMALTTSDAVIVPVEVGSLHSVEGLDKVLKLIMAIQETNPDLNFLKLVMNKADKRTGITKVMINKIKKEYNGRYFKTILSGSTAIQQAEFLRTTVFKTRPQERILVQFRNLAKELIGYTNG